MALDRQVAALIARRPRIWDDVSALTIEKARAWGAPDGGGAPPVPCEHASVAVLGGTIPLRIYRPDAAPSAGVVLWLHGGGFCMGSLDAAEPLAHRLAIASGATVVSVGYRLAPEHPFPTAPEDCYAALCWAAERAAGLSGRDAATLAVAGDSAGGNLAAVASLMARDRGGPAIALQALLYPMTSRHLDAASRTDPACAALAPWAAIEWIWGHYLGEADGVDPLASPLLAASHHDLPHALVVTAQYDLLRDEGETYAAALRAAGVDVELRRYAGMSHGFVDWLDELSAALECIAQIGGALRAALTAHQAVASHG
jgi:acetyl esterase